MADFTTKQYLDFAGLEKYDELIKVHIDTEKGKVLDLVSRSYPNKGEFNNEVTARQEADATHTADIATNKKNIEDLAALVGGPIPEGATSTNVIDYIQEKTTGIATDAALEKLTERVKNVEDNKADKATTLAGYGITDAYTKDEIDATVQGINASINGHGLSIKGLNEAVNKKADAEETTKAIADAKDEAIAADETFAISYDKENKKILLTGSKGTNTDIPTDDFIKDGMISSVAISEDGTKLVITWNTDAGKDATEIALTELVDVMTGVDGTTIKVDVSADDKISAEVKTGSLKDGHIAADAAIAKSKLASDVQTSLEKADTAVQPAALDNYYTKEEAEAEFMDADEVDTKINALNANAENAEGDIRVQVVQTAGKITGVTVRENLANLYDAKGDAEAAYTAIESIPQASIEGLFAINN